jgi:hypothetical protein
MCKQYHGLKFTDPTNNILHGNPSDPGEFPHMAAGENLRLQSKFKILEILYFSWI